MKAADAGGHEYSNTTPAYKGREKSSTKTVLSDEDETWAVGSVNHVKDAMPLWALHS